MSLSDFVSNIMGVLLAQNPRLKPVFEYLSSPLANAGTSDVTIYCGDGILLSHKIVLASISPLLAGLLHENTQDKHVSLILPEFSVRSFAGFLEHIYTFKDVRTFFEINKYLGISESVQSKLFENNGAIIRFEKKAEPTTRSESNMKDPQSKKKDLILVAKNSDMEQLHEIDYSPVTEALDEDAKLVASTLDEVVTKQEVPDDVKVVKKDSTMNDEIIAKLIVKYNIKGDSPEAAALLAAFQKQEKDPSMWDDPSKVDFFFIKTGKSVGPGVLCTHGGKYKFQKQNSNKNGTTQWFHCADKAKNRSGCLARASIKKTVTFHETTGEEVVTWKLSSVSSVKHHSLYHIPAEAEIMADAVMAKMKAAVLENPFGSVKIIRDRVIKEEIHNKLEPEFAKQIKAYLPQRIENTLHSIRRASINKSINELNEING